MIGVVHGQAAEGGDFPRSEVPPCGILGVVSLSKFENYCKNLKIYILWTNISLQLICYLKHWVAGDN